MSRESTKWLNADQFRNCPLCGNDSTYLLSDRMQFDLNLHTVICRSCSMVYTNPMPAEDVYNEFYTTAYAGYYGKISTAINTSSIPPSVRNRLDFIKPYIGSDASLLEIGPGNGAFLYWASKHFTQVKGVEPSLDFVAKMKGYEIEVLNGTVESFDPGPEKYTVICMFHVLEHFYDVNRAIRKIKSLLDKDGYIVLEIPNILKPFKALESYFLRYVHPSNFSPYTISKMLERHGFEICFIDEGGEAWQEPQNIFCIAQLTSMSETEPNLSDKAFNEIQLTLQKYRANKLNQIRWTLFSLYHPVLRFVRRVLLKFRRMVYA